METEFKISGFKLSDLFLFKISDLKYQNLKYLLLP